MSIEYAIAGAIVGLVVGLTGVGGGALLTPILMILGVEPSLAIGTDLWFAAATKLVGARSFQLAGQVDWAVAKRLWCGSLPAALLAAIIAYTSRPAHSSKWLTVAVGTLVLVAAVGVLLSPLASTVARRKTGLHATNAERLQSRCTMLAGAILGFCVALTSVGAGALGSVALVFLYPVRMTPTRLVATDLVHAIPLAVLSGLVYLVTGAVDGSLLLNLLVGSIPAILLGSMLANILPARYVRYFLAISLFGVGARALF